MKYCEYMLRNVLFGYPNPKSPRYNGCYHQFIRYFNDLDNSTKRDADWAEVFLKVHKGIIS